MSRTRFVRCGVAGCREMVPEGSHCEAHQDSGYTAEEADAICQHLLDVVQHQTELRRLRAELDQLTEG